MVQSRLLDIAVREFGSKGAEGVSTREIAAAAGTAMSSITYHYGGKDGLYLAAADHIAAEMAETLAPALACDPDGGDRAHARECIHQLLGQLIATMLTDKDSDSALFIMREQMNPGIGFDRIYDGAMGALAERLVRLVTLATGVARPLADVTTVLLLGQVVVWRASRALAARLLATAPTDHAALIRAEIAHNTDVILDRLSVGRQEPR